MYRVNSTQCSYKTDDDKGKPPSTLLLGLQEARRYDGPITARIIGPIAGR